MRKILTVLFLLFVVVLLVVTPASAQVQRARSWQEVIAACPTITVGEIQSADNDTTSGGLNRNYGQRARLREAIRRSRGYGSYGYGAYGGRYGYDPYRTARDTPIYSTLDPTGKMSAVAQTLVEQELEALGANVLAPATGPNSAKLQVLEAEAKVGRQAGQYGDHTWETASCVVVGEISILGETVATQRIDGRGIGQVANAIGQATGNFTAWRVLNGIGRGAATVQTQKQERFVSATVRLQVLNLRSRQSKFSADGTDKVRDDRFVSHDVAGFYEETTQHPNPELLVKAAVAKAFGKQIN